MRAFSALLTALLVSGVGAASAAGIGTPEGAQAFRDRASRTLNEGHRAALERRGSEARMKAQIMARKAGAKPGHSGLGNKAKERAMRSAIMRRKLTGQGGRGFDGSRGGPPAGFKGRGGADDPAAGRGFDGGRGGPPAGFKGRGGADDPAAGRGFDGGRGGPPAGFRGRDATGGSAGEGPERRPPPAEAPGGALLPEPEDNPYFAAEGQA